MYWWQWVLFGVGIELAVSLILTIRNRAVDIHNSRNTRWNKQFMNLLWPVGVLVIVVPYVLIEYPSQLVAKYLEYKRRKKFPVNKIA